MTGRLLVALVMTLALVGGVPAAAISEGGGGDNVVMVFNEADGATRSGSQLAVSPAASDTVDNENIAYAKSSCAGCRTVAAGLQAVLITSDASDVQPKNLALAVNENCSSCRTFAGAYQYVVTTDGPVYLSQEARQDIRAIRGEVADLVASDLSFVELEAALDRRYERFQAVVDGELRRAGRPVEVRSVKRVSRAG